MVESKPYTWNNYEGIKSRCWLRDFVLVSDKCMTALGRKQDLHLTWYSSTHQKGDDDLLRSDSMRTPLIG